MGATQRRPKQPGTTRAGSALQRVFPSTHEADTPRNTLLRPQDSPLCGSNSPKMTQGPQSYRRQGKTCRGPQTGAFIRDDDSTGQVRPWEPGSHFQSASGARWAGVEESPRLFTQTSRSPQAIRGLRQERGYRL